MAAAAAADDDDGDDEEVRLRCACTHTQGARCLFALD